MGQCIGRGSDDPFNDIHPHIFSVLNIDENGSRKVEGRIEVTETDLILNQRGHDRIRWPLRSLRRYGFEAGVFSFESGRRCPTGPGIYAFRCSRAQNLFNLLQSRVRNPYIDGPYVESPHPDTRPRENVAPRPRQALLMNNIPSLAPGSYINISTPNEHQQNNSPPENHFEPLGVPLENNEIVSINDFPSSLQHNITTSDSREDLNSNGVVNSFEQHHSSPTSGIPGPLLSPTATTSTLLPGVEMDPRNNNVLKTSDLNGIIGTPGTGFILGEYNDKNQTTDHITSDIKQKPPALDLSTNQHIFPQRPKPDTPTYENVDLTKCPPRLHPKPTTPISPPTPQHSEIIHDHHTFSFSTNGMIPLLEGTTPIEQSPTEPHQLSYAVLDLNPPSSNVNHSPSSPTHSGKTPNRSPHFTYNSDLTPAKHLSKSADSLATPSSVLLQNPHTVQEEQIGCEYTHIDIRRTEAYLKSKEQNENNGHLAFDGASSNLASNSIPEDRIVSTNDIKEGNNNALTKALTKALPTINIDKSIFDFHAKRNSVISQ